VATAAEDEAPEAMLADMQYLRKLWTRPAPVAHRARAIGACRPASEPPVLRT